MNVKLLRKVKKHILEEPKRLYMSDYIKIESKSDIGREYPKCGTAACIAGWTCILAMKPYSPSQIQANFNEPDKAAKLLGLTANEAQRLFLPTRWPWEFRLGCTDSGEAETAQVAAARIEHFIKTNGEE